MKTAVMRPLSFFLLLPLLAINSVAQTGTRAADGASIQPTIQPTIQPFDAPVRLFVADKTDNTVTVIDPATNKIVSAIPVSGAPQGLAVSTDGRSLYVSGIGGNLDVVDLRTLKATRHIVLGQKAGCIAVAPDGRRAFVCIPAGREVAVVDTAPMQRLRSINLGGDWGGAPNGLFVTPEATRMVSAGDRRLTFINIRGEKPEFFIPVEGVAEAVAFDSDKNLVIHRLFAQIAGQKSLDVIDYAARKVTEKLPLPAVPSAIAVTPDHKTLWVAVSDTLVSYSLSELKKTASVAVDRGPSAIVCASDSARCYVSNTDGGTVSVIDTRAGKEMARIPAGKAPGRMVLSDKPPLSDRNR